MSCIFVIVDNFFWLFKFKDGFKILPFHHLAIVDEINEWTYVPDNYKQSVLQVSDREKYIR